MSIAVFNTLPRLSETDVALQAFRARMTGYLEGPLPALSTVDEPVRLRVLDNVPAPASCAWWQLASGTAGFPASSLEFFEVFRQRLPDLPDSPEDFLARLAVDRPLAFSKPGAQAASEGVSTFWLTCVAESPQWHILFFYSPNSSLQAVDFPGRAPWLDFSFECALCAGFLPFSMLAGARRGDVIFPGWPAKDSLWLGRYDMWIPFRFGTRWEATGDWFMKPSAAEHFPLEISVELGRIRLRGRDLASLSRGSVLPLGMPLGSSVNLVCDNRVLARGELVAAGGELAVRLLSDVWMDDSEPQNPPSQGE